MKYAKKYKVNIQEVVTLNANGRSLPEISKTLNVPRTTLNRYLHGAGFSVIKHFRNTHIVLRARLLKREVFNTHGSWKNALIRKFGHKCAICGYSLIVESHHIISRINGGLMSIKNGVLLCPNHHAEAHAGILNVKIALIKSGELLENQMTDNQQPSLESKQNYLPRVEKGSETNSQVKTVMETRVPESGKQYGRRKINSERLSEVSGQDIVQTTDIIN